MVDEISIDGGEIKFKVGSIVDQQDQQVPSQLIGPSSRFASLDPMAYAGSTQRFGTSFGSVTLIAQRSNATPSRLVSVSYPVGYALPPTGYFDGGFVVWVEGPLYGMRRSVAHSVSDGVDTITFYLSQPYPYEQNQYSTGYLVGFAFDAYSLRNPQTTDPLYNGFPDVPLPEDAL
jgi:hypothetical protein